MLQRKIERKLLDWKRHPNHKPLIIKGCRQCGKTYSVMHFAKVHYKQVVYFNFLEIRIIMIFFQVLWQSII